jgi:phenylacetic acid degradation protein
VLHGCTVRDNALVGMNAVVMDGAEIGECSFVAALSFVRARFLVPPRTVVAGIPAKILRELTQEEIDWKRESDFDYIEIARRSHASLELVEALTEPDAEGVRMNVDGISPLFKVRKN